MHKCFPPWEIFGSRAARRDAGSQESVGRTSMKIASTGESGIERELWRSELSKKY
jgi:hypothetical protein